MEYIKYVYIYICMLVLWGADRKTKQTHSFSSANGKKESASKSVNTTT